MLIVWLFVAMIVLGPAVPAARAELRLRRRAAAELPSGLAGQRLRSARRAKLAELRHQGRPSVRPAGNTTDLGSPGTASGC